MSAEEKIADLRPGTGSSDLYMQDLAGGPLA